MLAHLRVPVGWGEIFKRTFNEHASPYGKAPGEKAPGERKKIGVLAMREYEERPAPRRLAAA
jgi:hypothetical protein